MSFKLVSNYVLGVVTLAAIPIAYFQFRGADESELRLKETSINSEQRIVESIDGSSSNIVAELNEMRESLIVFKNTDFSVASELFDSIAKDVCNIEYGPEQVKYDRGYTLSEIFNNKSSYDLFIHKYRVNYINPQYLDRGAQWSWTDAIKENGYQVGAGESVRYLHTDTPWRIALMPSSSAWDFAIIKTTFYDSANDTSKDAIRQKSTSCIRYKVVAG